MVSRSTNTSLGRQRNSSGGSLSSPQLILFILLLSTIGLIALFHMLPKDQDSPAVPLPQEHSLMHGDILRERESLLDFSLSAAEAAELHEAKRFVSATAKRENNNNYNNNYNPQPVLPAVTLPLSSAETERRSENDRRTTNSLTTDNNNNRNGNHVDTLVNNEKSDTHDNNAFDNKRAVEVTQARESSQAGAALLGEDSLLLVICSNRPDYLKRTLSHVLKYHPRTAVPILISQDGDNSAVNRVIEDAQRDFRAISSLPFTHTHHVPDRNIRYENGYFKLADHFKFALNRAFADERVRRVIILEEDLQIAPDFFEFFAATKSLLDNDDNLLAVSAWNDNGFASLVRDKENIVRSDFFPGLGWMLSRRVWEELAPKWPRAYWDDWLREPKQRRDRHILRPEVCRTLHFGTHGVSNAQYSEYLESILLNDEFVPFTQRDLSHLSTVEKWDNFYLGQVRAAREIPFSQLRQMLLSRSSLTEEVRVVYGSVDEGSRAPDSFTTYCSMLGCMNNVKAGVPRTAYKGIVTIRKGPITVHLTPSSFR